MAVLFVLQAQQKGVPDNQVMSEPIAVLFVLQTQRGGGPGQSGDVGGGGEGGGGEAEEEARP